MLKNGTTATIQVITTAITVWLSGIILGIVIILAMILW
jgi:hypothetical protein